MFAQASKHTRQKFIERLVDTRICMLTYLYTCVHTFIHTDVHVLTQVSSILKVQEVHHGSEVDFASRKHELLVVSGCQGGFAVCSNSLL